MILATLHKRTTEENGMWFVKAPLGSLLCAELLPDGPDADAGTAVTVAEEDAGDEEAGECDAGGSDARDSVEVPSGVESGLESDGDGGSVGAGNVAESEMTVIVPFTSTVLQL